MQIQTPDELMDLSVIMPTYNAKALAHRSVDALHQFLGDTGLRFEILLVDDGSRMDQRPDESMLPVSGRLIQVDPNRGKGYAVRAGLMSATGRCRVFTDVDLPYGLPSILTCYEAVIDRGADFVYGDRSLPASSHHSPPSPGRRLSSIAFRLAVLAIAGLPPTDTQCGLKGLRGDVADALAPLLQTDHFAFDVEIFRCARDSGLVMQPIPVHLVNGDASTVRLLRDSMTMFRDLVAIRGRAIRGHYRSHELDRAAELSRT
jgi:dolichyl-phosphate beta-glucosyltransferase